MNNCTQPFLESDDGLQTKLEEISILEKEHDLVGWSVSSEAGTGEIVTEDVVDYVLAITRRTAELLSPDSCMPRREKHS